VVLKEVLHPEHPTFLVIAHRGASYSAPENTMIAFELAVSHGANMIEVDILPSSDGVPVVIHDALTKRLTGTEADIRNIHSSEISGLSVSLKKNKGYGSEPIPTLKELLAWAKEKIFLDIEIKPEGFRPDDNRNILDTTIELISEFNMMNSVLISSFSSECIRQCRLKAPEITTGVLYDRKEYERKDPVQICREFGANSLHLKKRSVTGRLMERAGESKIPVLVYTINRKRSMKNLIRKGVKGIFTDKPSLLKEVSEEMQA
jgi:glycerophosphoryl diester phosphodiesterase